MRPQNPSLIAASRRRRRLTFRRWRRLRYTRTNRRLRHRRCATRHIRRMRPGGIKIGPLCRRWRRLELLQWQLSHLHIGHQTFLATILAHNETAATSRYIIRFRALIRKLSSLVRLVVVFPGWTTTAARLRRQLGFLLCVFALVAIALPIYADEYENVQEQQKQTDCDGGEKSCCVALVVRCQFSQKVIVFGEIRRDKCNVGRTLSSGGLEGCIGFWRWWLRRCGSWRHADCGGWRNGNYMDCGRFFFRLGTDETCKNHSL